MATEIWGGGDSVSGDAEQQQKRYGTTELEFWGKPKWRRRILARMLEVEMHERREDRMRAIVAVVDIWEDNKGQQQLSDIHIPIVGVEK